MKLFSRRLLAWYERHKRDFPWRRTHDPYRIWLSEILLQQTRVEAVIPYYEKFLARFPDVLTLAKAPLDDVFKTWEGAGYYARARNLHRAAQVVANERGGKFPRTLEGLVGTARDRALHGGRDCEHRLQGQCAGRGRKCDTRPVSLFWHSRGPENERDAGTIVGPGDVWCRRDIAREFNQALMELGATICLPKNPPLFVVPRAKKSALRGRKDCRMSCPSSV